jgi:hypothetical protein
MRNIRLGWPAPNGAPGTLALCANWRQRSRSTVYTVQSVSTVNGATQSTTTCRATGDQIDGHAAGPANQQRPRAARLRTSTPPRLSCATSPPANGPPSAGSHGALPCLGPPARVPGSVKACLTMRTGPRGWGVWRLGVEMQRCTGVSTRGIRAAQGLPRTYDSEGLYVVRPPSPRRMPSFLRWAASRGAVHPVPTRRAHAGQDDGSGPVDGGSRGGEVEPGRESWRCWATSAPSFLSEPCGQPCQSIGGVVRRAYEGHGSPVWPSALCVGCYTFWQHDSHCISEGDASQRSECRWRSDTVRIIGLGISLPLPH